MSCLYVLRLDKEGYYYIGKSDEPSVAFMSHWSGKEAEITRKYKPRGIELIIENVSEDEVYRQINKYKVQYGYDKVYTNLLSILSINKDESVDYRPLFDRIMEKEDIYSICCKRNSYLKKIHFALSELVAFDKYTTA